MGSIKTSRSGKSRHWSDSWWKWSVVKPKKIKQRKSLLNQKYFDFNAPPKNKEA